MPLGHHRASLSSEYSLPLHWTGSSSDETAQTITRTDHARVTEGSADESRNDGATGDDETGGGNSSETS